MKIDRCGFHIVLENDASSAQKEGLPRRMEAQINKLKLESNGKLALLSMGEHVSPFSDVRQQSTVVGRVL